MLEFKNKKNIVTIVGAIISLIGLTAGLLYLCGIFAHHNRLKIVDELTKTGFVSKDAPGFNEFLKDFPPPNGWELKDIKGIGPISQIASGGKVTPIGPIIYLGYGKQTKSIVDFEKAIQWAKYSFHPWISWVITFVGWVVVVMGICMDNKKNTSGIKKEK